MMRDNRESITELFLINTQAHVLSSGFNFNWATRKINELVEFVSEQKAVVFGYMIKEKVVGFIWAFPYKYAGESRYLLNALVVLPKFRNQHIACDLFTAMERYLAIYKMPLYTYVDTANRNAHRFYLGREMIEEGYQLVKDIIEKGV